MRLVAGVKPLCSAESLHGVSYGVMDGMLVVNILLLDMFLFFYCLLLHVGQSHDGVYQFVYGGGLGVGVVAGVRFITERLLGWGNLGWGHLVVFERSHLVGIVSMRVFPFGITLGWMV